MHPQLAWDAFYRDEYSLRDSYCIGRQCTRVVCAKEEEKAIEKEDILEKSREAGEDLNKNSSVEGCPLLPADVLPPSPCLSPGWGTLLPYAARTSSSPSSAQAEP